MENMTLNLLVLRDSSFYIKLMNSNGSPAPPEAEVKLPVVHLCWARVYNCMIEADSLNL